MPWGNHDASVAALLRAASGLTERRPAMSWQLFWCAGAAVVGSTRADLDAEVAILREFLDEWQPPSSGGAMFLASSAGGVYAGSHDPPFTESTEPSPLAPYGHAKLAVEGIARQFSERTGTPLLIGRLANLYGPGQDIAKPQGLISQLCRAQLTRQPISIYVSLDTMRDYIYVEDAAAVVVEGLDAVAAHGGQHVKIVASGRSTTVGALIGELRRLTRRHPPVTLGTSAVSRFQVRDLRLRSVAWPPHAGLVRTPLAAGISATLTAVGSQLRAPVG